MGYLKAAGIKYIIIGIITFSIYGIFNDATISYLFLMSLAITVSMFIVGDLLILPRLNSFIATVIDFGLSFIAFFALGSFIIQDLTPLTISALGSAYLLAVTEPLFHAYLIEKIFPEHTIVINRPIPQQLQTEIAEEIDVLTDSEALRERTEIDVQREDKPSTQNYMRQNMQTEIAEELDPLDVQKKVNNAARFEKEPQKINSMEAEQHVTPLPKAYQTENRKNDS